MRTGGPYTVTISYVGFKEFVRENVYLQLGNSARISTQLSEDASVLDEVVVIGYGTQKKSHLTGAISKVKNEDLEQIAVPRVEDKGIYIHPKCLRKNLEYC